MPSPTLQEVIAFSETPEVTELYELHGKHYDGETTTDAEDKRFAELYYLVAEKNRSVGSFGISMFLCYCAKYLQPQHVRQENTDA